MNVMLAVPPRFLQNPKTIMELIKTNTPIVHLIDFGSATAVGGDPITSNEGVDPEALDNNACTEKSDIFAWGNIAAKIFSADANDPGACVTLSDLKHAPTLYTLITKAMGTSAAMRPSWNKIISTIQEFSVVLTLSYKHAQ
jgi:hypothetical protein